MRYTNEQAAALLYRVTGMVEPSDNCDGLAMCVNEAISGASQDIRALTRIATGEVRHVYRGKCPDAVEGFDSRDPDCPACQALLRIECRISPQDDPSGAPA